MKDFKRLNVWLKSNELTLDIYRLTQRFPNDEWFGLTSQLRRASVPIGSNLAEGCGRGSDADYLRFVHIATGSACEVESQLLVARDLNYLAKDEHAETDKRLQEIKRMLAGLVKHLRP